MPNFRALPKSVRSTLNCEGAAAAGGGVERTARRHAPKRRALAHQHIRRLEEPRVVAQGRGRAAGSFSDGLLRRDVLAEQAERALIKMELRG